MVGGYQRSSNLVFLAIRSGDVHYPGAVLVQWRARYGFVIEKDPGVVIAVTVGTGHAVERLAVLAVVGQGHT